MTSSLVEMSRKDGTVIATLNRPEKRNALTTRLLDELADIVKASNNDPTARVIVITGNGGCFSSGADLAEAVKVRTSADAAQHLEHFRNANDAIESCTLPVIAAISGPCMTGGLEIALACDLRIGDETSTFAMTSTRIGSLAAAGGTQRLPRLIGISKAKELMMLGDRFDAPTAFLIGLLNRLVVSGDALNVSLRLAAELALRAPLSLALLKQAIREGMQMPLPEALTLEASLGASIFETEDRVEGMTAFLERREPRFSGT